MRMCVYKHKYNTGAFLRGFVFCGYIYPSGVLIAITAVFPFVFYKQLGQCKQVCLLLPLVPPPIDIKSPWEYLFVSPGVGKLLKQCNGYPFPASAGISRQG